MLMPVASLATAAELAVQQVASNQTEGSSHDQGDLPPAFGKNLPGKDKSSRSSKREEKALFAVNPKSPAKAGDGQNHCADRQQPLQSFSDPYDHANSGDSREQQGQGDAVHGARGRNINAKTVNPRDRLRLLS